MLPMSINMLWSRTISRLSNRLRLCCSDGRFCASFSSCAKWIGQTSLSSRAKALQACSSALMASSEHLAGDVKTGDLFTAVHRQHAGLERADSHGIQRAQRIARAVQRGPLLTLTRCTISVSRRSTSAPLMPIGRHNSSTLQLEHAVLVVHRQSKFSDMGGFTRLGVG
jgi:hypothetical protein